MQRGDTFFEEENFGEHETGFLHNERLAAQSHQVSTNFDYTFDSMKTNQQLEEQILQLKNWLIVLNQRQLTKRQLFQEQKKLLQEKIRIFNQYQENIFQSTNLHYEIVECFQKLNGYVTFYTKYYFEQAKRAQEQKQRKVRAELEQKYKAAKKRNNQLKILNKEQIQERVEQRQPLKFFAYEMELLEEENKRMEEEIIKKKKFKMYNHILGIVKKKYDKAS